MSFNLHNNSLCIGTFDDFPLSPSRPGEGFSSREARIEVGEVFYTKKEANNVKLTEIRTDLGGIWGREGLEATKCGKSHSQCHLLAYLSCVRPGNWFFASSSSFLHLLA